MSNILSRSTLVGSFALVTGGGSTSTYGTLPTTGDDCLWLRVASVSIQEAVTSVVVEDLAGTGSGIEGARYVVAHEAAGDVRLAVTHEGIGGVLYWALGGSPSSTGSGPYTHTYPTGVASPALSAFFVYQASDGTTLQDEWFGLQVNSLQLDIEAGGIAYATLNVRGAVASRSSTYQLGVASTQTPDADPYSTTIPVLGRTGSVLSYGGNSVSARSASLSFTRSLDRAVDFGGSYPAEGVLSAPTAVTLTVTRAADESDTATLRAAHMAGTSANLTINFTSGTKVFHIDLNNAVVTSYSAPFTAGGALVETVTFTAQALASGDYGFRFRVVNATSAAVPSNGTVA